jgi:sugar phosphate isomerase/epimerase
VSRLRSDARVAILATRDAQPRAHNPQGDVGVKTCLCSIACKNGTWTAEQIIDLAVELKYDAIELWGNFLGDVDEARRRQILQYCRDRRLAVPMISPYIGFFDITKGNLLPMVAECRKFLEIARSLGVPTIRSFAGFVCEITSATSDAANWAYAINGFAEYAAMAEQYGIDLALETHQQSLIDSLSGIEMLLRGVPSRRMKINFQIDEMPENSKMSITAIWNRLRDRVVHAHYHVPASDQAQSHTRELFRCMKKDHWDGYISVEYCKGEKAADVIARVGLEHLKEDWAAA